MAEWRKLTSDPEILQTVQGYQIDFLWPPVQRTVPRQVSMSKVKHKACTKEVEMMERKGAITQVDHCPGEYISTIFVVPKGSGGFRPVFNMKKLNHAIRDEHFKMESIQSVKHLIQRGDFMISVDLKDAYFAIPIHAQHRKFLRFEWEEKLLEFQVCPFGMKSAPRMFTKLLKPVVSHLRKMSIRIVIYLDDLLLLADSRKHCLQQRDTIIKLLIRLGFIINWEKSMLIPTQKIRFLGHLVNSKELTLSLPQDKLETLQEECLNLMEHKVVSAKKLASLFRQDDCVSRGYSRGTGVLPLPSNGSHISSESGSSVSQCDRDQPDQHRRTELVAQLSSPMEWQSNAYIPPRSGDHIRCIPDGMGGPLQHGGDRGSLDSGRATVPYKLSGTVGGISGSQVICKEFERSPHSDETGQHYSPVIHPPSGGGHTHRHVVQFSSHNVALGLGKRSGPVGLSCSRSGECGGGLSVQGLQRQDRVDAVTTSFQGDVPVPEVLSNCRPVCLPAEPSTGQICRMEARSRSGGDRRLLPELAARERLCISALLDLGRDSPEDQERGGNSVGGSSNLDSPAMVSPTSAVSGSSAGPSSSDNRVSGAASLRSATPIVGESPSSGLDCLRRRYVAEGFSEKVSEVLSQSCRPSTHGQYESAWRAWCGWCNQRSLDPVSAPVVSVAEFLVEKEKDGLAFRTLGVYSAAISLYHLPVEGKAVGECAQLSKLKKGFFNRNPPKPRYLVTWDVEPVLRCLRGLPTWETLDLKSLTLKLVLLLALVLVGRVSSLVYIDTECLSVTQSSLRFIPSKLLKQSRPGRIPQCVHIESFSDKRLCPVYGVKHYLAVTRPFRQGESQLFLSYIRPHKKVGTSTISRWILKMLEIAGVDVSLFRAHSTRGAAASASTKLGVSMSDIMKAAGLGFRFHFCSALS